VSCENWCHFPYPSQPILSYSSLDSTRAPDVWAKRIIDAYDDQVRSVELFNHKLEQGEIQPSAGKRLLWRIAGKDQKEKLDQWRESARRKPNMLLVMYHAVAARFWIAVTLKFVGDACMMGSPLVLRVWHPNRLSLHDI